jgi:hypothetical protein
MYHSNFKSECLRNWSSGPSDGAFKLKGPGSDRQRECSKYFLKFRPARDVVPGRLRPPRARMSSVGVPPRRYLQYVYLYSVGCTVILMSPSWSESVEGDVPTMCTLQSAQCKLSFGRVSIQAQTIQARESRPVDLSDNLHRS